MTAQEEFFILGTSILSAPTVLLILLLTLVGWHLHRYVADMSRYPRGPLPLPFIGNVLHLLWQGDMLEFLMRSWSQYGDVFTIKIGSKMFVVLNGYETISEALVRQAESFSEHNEFYNLIGSSPETEGLIFGKYPVWKKHRKLVLKVFKDTGYVRQGLQENVNQEIEKVIPEIHATKEQPFVIEHILEKAVSNVTSNVVFGSRFEYSDKEFIALLTVLKKLVTRGRMIAIASLFPILRYAPLDYFKLKDTVDIGAQMLDIMEKRISEHENKTELSHSTFIAGYLAEIQKDKDLKTGYFTKRRCMSAMCDLFGAGSETTSTALDWAFLHCIVHPEMQQRIHEEIDQVVGQRAVVLSDRQKMPFVNAFLTEVLRFANVVPLALPHRVINDTVLKGQFIPKDTEIIVNLHSILHDKNIFAAPSTFRPSRFLDDEGRFAQPEKLTPFGIGRRSCLGEELAQIELFLFFTSIIQRFNVVAAPGAKLSTKGTLGITRRPDPYQIIAMPRLVSSESGSPDFTSTN